MKFAALASHGLTEFIPILRLYLAGRVIEILGGPYKTLPV